MIKNVLLEGEPHSIEATVALVFCLESAKVTYFNFVIDFCVFLIKLLYLDSFSETRVEQLSHRAAILDKIKWNSKRPSPRPQIKNEAARRAKTRHFPILDLGGRGGGLDFPFILSKNVGCVSNREDFDFSLFR